MSKSKISKKQKQKKDTNNSVYFFILVAVLLIIFLVVLVVVQNNPKSPDDLKDDDLYEENTKITPEKVDEQITPGKEEKTDEIVAEYQINKHSTKEDFLGKPSVIYFGGTYCGACKASVPSLKEVVWNEYKLLTNIWVQVVNDDLFDVEDIAQGYNDNIDMSKYLEGCGYIPSFVVLDKEGKTTISSCGSEKSIEDIKNELDRLLS